MKHMKVLVINCGSSSLKYQLFLLPEGLNLVKGMVDKIGQKGALIKQEANGKEIEKKKDIPNHAAAVQLMIECLLDPSHGMLHELKEINAVGHRVVHGGENYSESVIIDDKVLTEIESLSDLAPLHNPVNLQGIRAAMDAFIKAGVTDVPHTATFDTAFHQTIPDYAYMYAIPRELYEKFKIRKYGFHGTSHRYVATKALEFCKRAKENTSLITVHLGNGCSITAIQNGKSIDTSMGLTPLEGLVMGTRSGDLDPAIINYLVGKGFSSQEVTDVLNKKSGLLGMSQISNDMREIKAEVENGNKLAELALEAFAYRVKKYIGAYCAIMVKVDILVFTGGIGQNDIEMRKRICTRLEGIGIHIDYMRNKDVGSRLGIVSKDFSPITIAVIPTDEEERMARDSYELLNK